MAGTHKSWEPSVREVLIPLLRPDEPLGIALSGPTGWFEGVSLVDLFMTLLDILGGVPTSELNRTTYIGITDQDLVFATTKNPNKPSSLQRAPLSNVSIVKFKESHTPFLTDVLVIDTGTKKLTLSTEDSLRPVIQELSATLARRKHEAGMPESARHFQDTSAQQARPLPFHVRLFRPIASALQDVATTVREDGPARASIRASRYSFNLFLIAIAADFVFIFGTVALGSIFPTTLWAQLRDVLLFILLLPVLLSTFLSVLAGVLAAGLAIYSIFKGGERPRTIITALLRTAGLILCYTVAACGVLLLGAE